MRLMGLKAKTFSWRMIVRDGRENAKVDIVYEWRIKNRQFLFWTPKVVESTLCQWF